MQSVTIITDGSCRPNPGTGGWAAIIQWKRYEKILNGSQYDTTSNRMELQAVIAGLAALTKICKVEIHSDSTYVIQGFTLVPGTGQLRIHQWKKRGWRTAAGKPLKNQDLWKPLLALCGKHKVVFVKVLAHSNHATNIRADALAYQAAKEIA